MAYFLLLIDNNGGFVVVSLKVSEGILNYKSMPSYMKAVQDLVQYRCHLINILVMNNYSELPFTVISKVSGLPV